MKVFSSIGEYWIIRHKPTGDWLPELVKPLRGGYTHTEPCRNHAPRLFTTERGAKNALWWWLRGVTFVNQGQSYDGEWEENWHHNPKPERKAEDMEIIKVDLSHVIHEVPVHLVSVEGDK